MHKKYGAAQKALYSYRNSSYNEKVVNSLTTDLARYPAVTAIVPGGKGGRTGKDLLPTKNWINTVRCSFNLTRYCVGGDEVLDIRLATWSGPL
jgi:hypothetical protein